jgi:hypothetical protein
LWRNFSPDEIFASAAKVSDIETIDQITATNLQASGTVINAVSTSITSGITSSASIPTSTSTNTTTTTTSSLSSSGSSNSSSGGGYSY